MTLLRAKRCGNHPMSLDLHAPNPMHGASGPTDAWSTIITRENYGVMSPLGATLWLPVSDGAVKGAGHRDAHDLIPGQSDAAFEEQIFGSSRTDASDTASTRRYPVVAVRAPLTAIALPSRIHKISADIDAWWRYAVSPTGLQRPVDIRFSEALRNLEHVMRVHVAGTFVAQGVVDALRKVAESIGRPGLHLELSTGYGRLVDIAVVAALNDVARGRSSVSEFLAEHGYRCAGEIEVSNPSWRERPELARRTVDKYRAAPEGSDPIVAADTRTRSLRDAERVFLAAVPRRKRPTARVLLKLAATFIPLREEGKAALARAFDGARAAGGVRGRQLVADGVIERPDDVSYLTTTRFAVHRRRTRGNWSPSGAYCVAPTSRSTRRTPGSEPVTARNCCAPAIAYASTAAPELSPSSRRRNDLEQIQSHECTSRQWRRITISGHESNPRCERRDQSPVPAETALEGSV